MSSITCPFAKTILSTRYGCEHSTRFCVAERIGAACTSTQASQQCLALVQALRENARFALQVTDTSGQLPFGKEMKILHGGLAGLHELMPAAGVEDGKIVNIHALVQAVIDEYGTLETIPYQQIVKSVSAYKPVRRRSER
jgi:hypothetical protein